MNFLLVIGITLLVVIIGGGGGYLIWLKTRPPKPTWNARVFQLAEGVKEKTIEGHIIKLQELRPYLLDVVEKVDKDEGIILYRLQRLKIPTPPIEGDVVDVWGGHANREVNILLHKGSCTILKRSYDKATGEMIFDPMPHSRINLMRSEIIMRKKRLESDKDIITAITPWIVAGICAIALVAVSYFMIDGFIKISDNNVGIAKENNDLLDRQMNLSYSTRVYNPNINNVGPQEQVKTYPSVESGPIVAVT